MGCACLKNSFDLVIGHTDRKHMTIMDASEWMADIKASEYEIIITNLTNGQKHKVMIKGESMNILSTKELFGTEDKKCIMDGFYCFQCANCGKSYKINRVYLANTECMINQLYVKAKSKEDKERVQDFYQDLKMIKVNAELGRMSTASEIFMTLTKKLLNIGCNECGCK